MLSQDGCPGERLPGKQLPDTYRVPACPQRDGPLPSGSQASAGAPCTPTLGCVVLASMVQLREPTLGRCNARGHWASWGLTQGWA